jgi:hypothetical protein
MRRPFLPEAVLLLVLLVLLLAVPSLQAAEPWLDVQPARSASVGPGPWGLLTRVWGFLTGVWSENGCEVDPSGRCLPPQGAVTVDNGCEMDPSGRCLPPQGSATVDNGCEADPDGRCRG